MASAKGGLEAANNEQTGPGGVVGAALDAAKTAALTFALCIPIVLLRTEQDTGRVTLMDRRILTRRYGRAILDSLPPFRRELAAS